MRIVLILMLLVISWSAYADPRPWMKQAEPNLGLFTSGDSDCPFSEADLRARVEGEFFRARLKPTQNLALNITIVMLCLPIEVGGEVKGYAVRSNMRFGAKTPSGNFILYETPDYGRLDISGGKDGTDVLRKITDQASLALTDYLKANME